MKVLTIIIHEKKGQLQVMIQNRNGSMNHLAQINMSIRITQGHALRIVLGLLTAVIIFHMLIIIRIISYEIVWAGRLKSVAEMYVLEIISILVNMIFLTTVLLKGNFIKNKVNGTIVNGILWLFLVLFTLNTVGNLMAKSLLEKAVFTPLTLTLSILIWIILKNKKNQPPE